MSQLWIKICGITRNSDAMAALGYGADAIGLNFYPPSPRAIDLESIRNITDGIEGKTEVVALFVDPSKSEVQAVLDSKRIDMLQFHGSESVEFCESFEMPYMKVFRVKGSNAVELEIDHYKSAKMIMLDSFSEQAPGGTGKVFDWEIAKKIVNETEQKIVVAGGLSVENVQTAVAQIHPFGVDVSSGVEKSHGVKDLEKVNAFIEGARSV
ncbi:MAG: phosphoribosylanthranilate isomerase [Pseudomonadales bacterium]|nr:phosphoribosylanthranilate isomerase [Pseudomonadales bacterium]